MSARCIECGLVADGDEWQLGQCCLFGTLFACSLECAKKWATENAAPGYRPGEPGFDVEIEGEPEEASRMEPKNS